MMILGRAGLPAGGVAGLSRAILAVAGASLLAGCARSPTTLPPAVRQLTLEITVAEPANPNYYYFFAIDADGDENDGPVPIVGGGPFWTGTWFNGWGMISDTDPPEEPSDYVLYHANLFQQAHNGAFVGIPYRTLVSDSGRRLSVTVDLERVLGPVPWTVDRLDITFITVDQLTPPLTPLRENYDALGEWPGVGFWWVSGFWAGVSQSTDNSQATTPEPADDVPGDIPALDIVDWSLTVNLPD